MWVFKVVDDPNTTTRYGVTTGRYGEVVDDPNTNTRYGVTTGRYGEPLGQSEDESLLARYQRIQECRGMMNNLGRMREAQARGGGASYSLMGHLRSLEEHPPTSFNRIYVP